MISYETTMEIDALCSAPDNWRRKRHLRKLLQEVHKEYNRTKKLIPVYQAALEHWKEVQREWQVQKRMYLDWEHKDWRQVQFKSTSEIKELKRELNELQRHSKTDKEYFHKIRSRYMEFLEFEKACRGE